MKNILLIFLITPFFGFSQAVDTINTVGMAFVPDTVVLTAGEIVYINPGSGHNAVEVSEATWLANGNSSNGGFSCGFGTGLMFQTDTIAKTYYYVCQPHVASMGMKGVIIAMSNEPTYIIDKAIFSSIIDLEVYPNPSRDVFNITFVSEDKQTLRVRILNVVGEEIYREDLEDFIGEYTKQVSLENYSKAIYFLEIETTNGIINKKLILQ